MNLKRLDTSSEARRIQEEGQRRLGPEGRLRAALDLSEAVREIRLAGLRSETPGVSEAELVRRFIAEMQGDRHEATP
jgi:hypothetical protein